MTSYTEKDLIDWDLRIKDLVDRFGLKCYPQEFEVCDHNEMLG
jgi:stage V sporulation protein R